MLVRSLRGFGRGIFGSNEQLLSNTASFRLILELVSARDSEIYTRIAADDNNKIIARRFDLHPRTAKRHIAYIIGKQDVASHRCAAARYRGDSGVILLNKMDNRY